MFRNRADKKTTKSEDRPQFHPAAYYNANGVANGGTPSGWTKKQDYAYTPDKLNRASVTENGVTGSYAASGMNQYTSASGQSPTWGSNFNLSNDAGATYSYDSANQLTSASKAGTTMQCLYDGLGRCVKRTVNGVATIYVYDGWKPVFEKAGDDSWYAYQIYGPGADEVLWRFQSNVGILRYHHDIHGSVMFLLDANGGGLEKYTYDAFGKPTITDWSGNVRTQSAYGNRFMFTGREYFPALGIYDYRHRMYQPELGRFLQTDPTGFAAGDLNLFRYCGDDPVDRTDPTGLMENPAGGWDQDGAHISTFVSLSDSAGGGSSGGGSSPQQKGQPAGNDKSKHLEHYSDWRDAVDSRREETMNLVHRKQIEYGGEVSQRNDNAKDFVARPPHPGTGITDVHNTKKQGGQKGKFQGFIPDRKNAPSGYHVVAFYYGHVYYDPSYFHNDAISAQNAYRMSVALFLPPQTGMPDHKKTLYHDLDTPFPP